MRSTPRRTFVMEVGGRSLSLAALSALALDATSPALAEADVGFHATPLLQRTTTDSGQTIEFPSGPNQISAFLVELAPGGEHSRHRHPFPIFAYVLEGTLTLDIEGVGEMQFPAGTAHLEPVNTWHRDINKGAAPVKWVVVFLGQAGKPFTERP
jgi:quercetin dioxygenase-like cupin family protein